MRLKTKKWLLLSSLGIALVCFGSCEPSLAADKSNNAKDLPYYAEATFTPLWFGIDSPELDTLHRISDFSLLNQLGETITLDSLQGMVYVVDFFFTSCPGICPKMTSNMAILQEAFNKEERVKLLSHTVLPSYDSVSVLQDYAMAKGVDDSKWWLLTGERDQIYRLGREDYFVEEDLGLQKSEDDFLHTENFILVDQNRHIRGIYNGLNTASVYQLEADLRSLLKATPPPSQSLK